MAPSEYRLPPTAATVERMSSAIMPGRMLVFHIETVKGGLSTTWGTLALTRRFRDSTDALLLFLSHQASKASAISSIGRAADS